MTSAPETGNSQAAQPNAENVVAHSPTGKPSERPVSHAHTDSHAPASDRSSENEDIPHETGAELKPTQSAASERMSSGQIGIVMFSLCMALFLAALDITIITTALPTIATHYKASSADYIWVGSAYLVACAGAVPCWGKLSDIWGRKPAILMANGIFFVGSLLSGVSVSIGMLIAGRVIQGIGGGGLVVLVNICISDMFSMRERGKFLGIVGGVWAIASAVGPLLGGVFTERVSWRWCFYINLPLDGTAFILLILFLNLETPRTPFVAGIKAIDWIGVITIVGGVVMFLLGLEAGGVTKPWKSAYALCLIIFGIVTIGIFFLCQWKVSKYPLMPLRLFKNRTNIAALAVCYCHGFVFIGGTYYLPLYFQTVLSATPILSGVYLFPQVITLSVMSAAVGIFIKKTGRYREPIWFGMLFMTLGYGLFIDIPADAQWAKIIIYQILAGVGVGPNFQSPLIALQNHVAPHDIAVATATFGFVRQLATSMSVVLGGVVFQNFLSKKTPELARELGPHAAEQLSGASLFANTGFIRSLPPAQKAVANQVITDSLHKMFIFYTVIAGIGLLVSLLIRRKELSKVHNKAKTGLDEQERVRKEEAEAKQARRSMHGGTGSRPGTANDEKQADVQV